VAGQKQGENMSAKGCQLLINSGMAWGLEGHVGRVCMGAIEDGACMLGTVSHKDYWGNVVPSRFEVKEGTKGSRQFVVERMGEDHADMLESVSGAPDPCDVLDEVDA
jgi:hypothetical protein